MLTLLVQSSRTTTPHQVTKHAYLVQTGWKTKFKSCFSDVSQSSSPSRYLSSIEAPSCLWMSSFKSNFGNMTMSLQVKFQSTVLKTKRETRLATKRKSKKLGWLIAGCCFSKKRKKERVCEDVSEVCRHEVTGNRPEPSYTKCSETQVLLSGEKRTEELVRPEPGLCFPTREGTFSDDVIKKITKKPDVEVKEPVPKGEKKIKARKPRPNFFVAVQVDNPEIHMSLRNIQESLVDHAPLMKNALVKLSTLHITFAVMHVADEEDLMRAENAMVASYDSIKEDLKKSPLILTFKGLSSFRNQVLFAELRMDHNYRRILTVYEKIASCFEEHGFDVRERDNFTPHLTIAKLSKDPSLRRKGLKQISLAWYEDYVGDTFGEQLVKSLQLLRMQGSEDGYYPCDKECFFDAINAEPKDLLEKRLLPALEMKKEVRKKIRDLTTEKLGQNKQN